jgi:mono/diheme cytochrome c family protein
VALIIYLTYFFTLFFSTRPPEPAAVPEAARAAAKKTEERLAEERRLLSTYGPVNPVTGTVRVPVDRAMELIVAESAQPAPARANDVAPRPEPTVATPKTEGAAAAPKPEAVAASVPVPAPSLAPAPAPAPVRVGLSPAQLYRAICIACHDTDGRGSIVRKAMPAIPDFTDARWQSSRTDAELAHTMLVGKGPLMLPMKEKLALAHTDLKEMVAFVRGFQPGRAAVAAAPQPQPAAPVPAPTAVASSVPAAPPAPTPAPAPGAPEASPTPSPTSPSAALALAAAGPAPELPPGLLPPPPPAVVAPAAVPSSPRRVAAANPMSPARLRASAELYRINCLVCHGPDGRGNVVRAAMPAIPDFTTRQWQSARDAAQLSVSILEGRGALMPPWHGKISPEQARDLVAYVRTFGPADLASADAPISDFGNRFQELSKRWAELDQQIRLLQGP